MADHVDQLVRAVAFIEARLDRPFDLAATSREAGMSAFHFSRVFRSVTGESASEYARKRALTVAADRLISSDEPIVDIAFNSGFEGQQTFTRAFRRWYGVPPARFRRRCLPYMLKDTPPLTREALTSLIAGETGREPSFEESPERTFIGVACDNTMRAIRIPRAWRLFLRRMREIEGAAGGSTYGIYSYDFRVDAATVGEDFPFRYLVALAVRQGVSPPEGMEVWTVAPARYAVFVHRGFLRDLGRTYRYIYKTWFPRQRRDFAAAPMLERRAPDYPGDHADAATDILIPVEG